MVHPNQPQGEWEEQISGVINYFRGRTQGWGFTGQTDIERLDEEMSRSLSRLLASQHERTRGVIEGLKRESHPFGDILLPAEVRENDDGWNSALNAVLAALDDKMV